MQQRRYESFDKLKEWFFQNNPRPDNEFLELLSSCHDQEFSHHWRTLAIGISRVCTISYDPFRNSPLHICFPYGFRHLGQCIDIAARRKNAKALLAFMKQSLQTCSMFLKNRERESNDNDGPFFESLANTTTDQYIQDWIRKIDSIVIS